jgi:hypothetical protein
VGGADQQLESRLDTLDDLVSKVESGQSRFSAELTKLDDGIAGRLAEIGVANTEVLDRQVWRSGSHGR